MSIYRRVEDSKEIFNKVKDVLGYVEGALTPIKNENVIVTVNELNIARKAMNKAVIDKQNEIINSLKSLQGLQQQYNNYINSLSIISERTAMREMKLDDEK